MKEKSCDHYLEVILDQNRIPHAQGWLGESMSDLEQKAIQFARTLFSKNSDSRHDEKLKAKNHPDFLIFEPSSKTGQYTIEQVRQITDHSQLFPHEACAQFFVLHHADRMSVAAANAFLKTLEEPIENTYFIFLIEHLEEVISTLRSRLQILCFDKEAPPIEKNQVKELELFLKKWPHFTYQDLYQTAQTLQEELDRLTQGDAKEVIAYQHRLNALFTEVEVWYTRNRDSFSFSYPFFQKHFEKARLGSLRSIKFSHCLEYLFLSLKQK